MHLRSFLRWLLGALALLTILSGAAASSEPDMDGQAPTPPSAADIQDDNVLASLTDPFPLAAAPVCDHVTQIPRSECEGLAAFYSATGGASWHVRTDWLATNTPCSWYGVSCAAGRVNGLSLSKNDLTGNATGAAVGLAGLPQLQTLDLSYNDLTGGIPSAVGGLSNLQTLNLNVNPLAGGIPTTLGNLSNLQHLRLNNCDLSGNIPTTLGNLSNLQELDMYNNRLSGSLPSTLGNLSNLQELLLSHNLLSGSIPPALGSLANLRRLDLYDNRLSGSIPSTLGNLSNLQDLNLGVNQLTSSIPLTLGNLSNLLRLILNDNRLSGSIPSTLGNLSNLQELLLSSNQLTGSIPLTLGNLSNLLRLILGINQLTGSIPSTLGNLSHLTELALGSNQLTGGIPSTLGNLSHLTRLTLGRNQLTGSIPTALGSLSALQILDLSFNQLSGSIPLTLGNLSSLWSLLLTNNQLTGSIPSSLGNLSNLRDLALNHNLLTGGIPSTLGNLSHLQGLYLHYCQLSGSVPSSLGNLSNLGTLNISHNPLDGALPQSLNNLRFVCCFSFENTNLCEPPDAAFQSWLANIPSLERTGVLCPTPTPTSTVTPTATSTRSPTPTRTAAPSGTATPSATPSASPTLTPTITAPAWQIRLPLIMRQRAAPFSDEFNAATLDPRWRWLNPDPAGWSLTERPGFLRIVTQTEGKNILFQNAPAGEYEVRTRLIFTPTANFEAAGILIYRDPQNYLRLARAYCDIPGVCVGNGLYFDRVEDGISQGGNFATTTTDLGEVYLHIVRRGDMVTASYSLNGASLYLIGTHTLSAGRDLPYIGLVASQTAGVAGKLADFDYFRLIDPSPAADIIFHNGIVLTEGAVGGWGAIGICKDRICFSGNEEGSMAFRGPYTQMMDLGGRTMMAGFVDAHTHLLDAAQNWGMSLEQIQEVALRNGVTTLGDAYTTPALLADMQALAQQKKLRLRTSLYLAANTPCGAMTGDWWKSYPPNDDTGAMLRIAGVKFFLDGGSCGCPAYSFNHPTCGFGDLWLTQAEVNAFAAEADRAGYPIALHALGDRAVSQALDAVAFALDGRPNTLHHRIEHNALIRDELLPRYGQLGIAPVIFGNYPCEVAGNPLPSAYLPWEWRWRDLLNANPGLPLAWHSDAPYVAPVSPLQNLYSMVSDHEMNHDGSATCADPIWLTQKTLTLDKALRAMTTGAAYALRQEDEIGTLRQGRYADLVVLSADPRDVAPEALKDIEVWMTMVGGKVEYCAAGQATLCPRSL